MGSLSSDAFERFTSTGSEPFSPLICLDATILVLLSVFTLTETICPRIYSKSRPRSSNSPLPVDMRPSKTPLQLRNDLLAFSLFELKKNRPFPCSKNLQFFSALRAPVWSKNRGGGGGQAPPLDPPLKQTFNLFNNTNQTSVTEPLLKDLLDFRDNPQIIPI